MMRTDVPILEPVVEEMTPKLSHKSANERSEVAKSEFVGREQPWRGKDNFRPCGDDTNNPTHQHHDIDDGDEEDLRTNLNAYKVFCDCPEGRPALDLSTGNA